jgi:hypothetical protein
VLYGRIRQIPGALFHASAGQILRFAGDRFQQEEKYAVASLQCAFPSWLDEPEVLMDGEHMLKRYIEVTQEVLMLVFDQLYLTDDAGMNDS